MPFKLLKQIISHLIKQYRCQFCSKIFTEDAVLVLASAPLSENTHSGLFMLMCPQCNAEAVVMVETTNVTEALKKEFIRVHTKIASKDKISIDEILDMHNFLKNWKGDLKELWKS